jgi:hypothetical protein
VDWIEGHNLATDDPELAAKIMDATAKLSAKVEKPVYHASINWRPDEAPARQEMKDIARRALKLMELEEHQALVVGHGDTAHPHLHMMINRVNPNTGKAWRTHLRRAAGRSRCLDPPRRAQGLCRPGRRCRRPGR